MPEPKQANSPSQPLQSNGARPSTPLAEPKRGSLIPGEEKVRAALRDCDMSAMEEMGSRAKPVLFKIIQDSEEDLLSRRFAADAAASLYGNSIRSYDRILCLLLQDKVGEAVSIGDDAVIQVLGIAKNRKENTLLRSIAIEVLVSIPKSPESYSSLSVVAALSSLVASEQEVPVLRVKIADELPKLARICDAAKMKLIRSGLDKASNSQNSSVQFAAEEAIQLIENGSGGFVDDDNPTLRISERK